MREGKLLSLFTDPMSVSRRDKCSVRETAQIAEQSAPDLIQKAMTRQEEEEKGLIEKAKDKLTGQ